MTTAKIHRPGTACYVRVHGTPDWLIAVVTSVDPLTAEIVSEHPVWKGCPVTRRDAYIRVDPRFWPRIVKARTA